LKIPAANRRDAGNSAKKVVIRHHQVHISDTLAPAALENEFDAVVRDVMYLGDRIRYTLEMGPTCKVIAEVGAEAPPYKKEARVRVELPGASCIVL